MGRFDPAWALAGRANALVTPAGTYVALLLPLGVPALLAYRLPARTFSQILVRLWPVLALAQIWFTTITDIGTFAVHAVEGLSIPFALLAVIGVRSVPINVPRTAKLVLGVAVVAMLIVPSGFKELSDARSVGGFGGRGMFVQTSEWNALEYLKSDTIPGAVLSGAHLGAMVPAVTGRSTWIGLTSWTPSVESRTVRANVLFSGRLDEAAASHLIRSSHATFVLSDCQHRADLPKLLPAVLDEGRRFGCAVVYRVRSS